MIKRQLTITFQKSVGGSASNPEVVEVVLIPLSSPSSSQDNITLTGGKQVKKVTLTEPTVDVTFEVTPSDSPGFSERILYRIGWRSQYLGRTFTTDFAMPDFDVHFDDLEELSAIIDGEVYLQQSDLGVINRVAKLDADGDLINAFGVKITGVGNATTVDNRLTNEIIARQQGDVAVRTMLESELSTQIQSVLQTTQNNLNAAVSLLEAADLTEKVQRSNAVTLLNATIDALETHLNAEIATLVATTDSHAATLLNKADLVGGKVPSSQLPSLSLTTAVAVADQAAMLALTTSQVQPGDLAVRPDGSWMLLQNPPSILANWIKISTGGEVLSVNGQTGVIVLSAVDVGARSSIVAIPSADVTGLDSYKSSTTNSITTLSGRVTTIENDATIVRLVSGVVPRTQMGTYMAFVSDSGQLVKKDGTPIVIEGSGAVDSVNGQTGIVVLDAADVGARPAGVDIPASDITGLETALGDVVFDDDLRLTNHRDPNPHKTTHALGGTDPLTPGDIGARALAVNIEINEVTDLSDELTDHEGRVVALEGRVDDLEEGSPPVTAASKRATKFTHFEATGDFSLIEVESPFGYNPTNPNANADGYYYDPAGAADDEGVFPYITPNGHLKLIRRNESNPVDPTWATQGDLDALTTTVGGKASTTALTALSVVVDGKASQTDFNTLSTTVGQKANQSALDATNTTVAGKADQSSLDTTNTVVSGKANQSDLNTLSSSVAGKASQTDLNTATGRLDTIETVLPNKADLSAGRVLLSQIPTNIPMTSVVNLTTGLAAKADLVSGKIPSSQLPSLATVETYAVANRAAMLALTTTQVQVGDQCIITSTTDKGTYTLVTSDPSQFANWMKHQQPDDLVSSVNGQTGTVVLAAADVGARSSASTIPQSDVSGLTAALAAKANSTDLTSGLASKTSTADVNSLITTSVICKQLVGRVATTNVTSLSGQQSIDGSLTPLGTIVLLTAQTSSVVNGIYQVNSGAWTRVSDMDTGSYFVRGTLALITGGTSHANEFWQETATSGVVGTNANNWVFAMKAGPPNTYSNGNGLDLTGTVFSVKAVVGGGVVVASGGVSVDSNVVERKYTQNVPGGANPVTITHNLGTLDVTVVVRDIGSGAIVLVPVSTTGLNTISIDFSSTPATNQYRVKVTG